MMNPVREYMAELQATLERLPEEQIQEAIQLLALARIERKQVFIMGNGGSASTATHFVCDLAKNTRYADLPSFRVIGLTDNMAIFSALANDEGYDQVFSQQLTTHLQPGDVVIAISASGNSPNVINAVELANRMGATTIGLTGFDGGILKKLVDLDIHVTSTVIEHVEDIHLMLEHLICKELREIGKSQAVSSHDLTRKGMATASLESALNHH
jgi:D-sedoheptulose 7-phosphate isomerase